MSVDVKHFEEIRRQRAEMSLEERRVAALEQIADSLEVIKDEISSLSHAIALKSRTARTL